MWLLTEGIVSLEQMRALAPLLGSSEPVYRAQIVGYFRDGTAADRAEVVVRADSGRPKILMYRDLTPLGRGFSRELLGLAASNAR